MPNLVLHQTVLLRKKLAEVKSSQLKIFGNPYWKMEKLSNTSLPLEDGVIHINIR